MNSLDWKGGEGQQKESGGKLILWQPGWFKGSRRQQSLVVSTNTYICCLLHSLQDWVLESAGRQLKSWEQMLGADVTRTREWFTRQTVLLSCIHRSDHIVFGLVGKNLPAGGNNICKESFFFFFLKISLLNLHVLGD